jgi:hypothetical protein
MLGPKSQIILTRSSLNIDDLNLKLHTFLISLSFFGDLHGFEFTTWMSTNLLGTLEPTKECPKILSFIVHKVFHH